MKILIVTSLYHPHNRGGGEISIKTIAEALVESGCEVAVLATGPGKGLSNEIINAVRVWRAGIKNIHWHHDKEPKRRIQKILWHLIDIFNPAMARFAKQVFASEKPDIVQIHVTTGWSSALLRWASRLDLPVVQVLHGYELLCPKANIFRNGKRCEQQCAGCRIARFPHRYYSKSFAAAVGISDFVLKRHISFGLFKDVSVKHTIHNARHPILVGLTGQAKNENAIDIGSSVNLKYPNPQRDGADVVRFGFMGKIAQAKGVDLLLQAFLRAAQPDAELWVAGMGDEGYVEFLTQKYQHVKIKFVGKSFPAQFFRDIDIAIVPSLWDEPLGVVVFEALAFGCPVIASCRGGIPEMIQPGINGIIFDPDYASELEDAIRLLSNDKQLRLKLSANAPASVQRFLSPARIAADYMGLYDSLVRRGHDNG